MGVFMTICIRYSRNRSTNVLARCHGGQVKRDEGKGRSKQRRTAARCADIPLALRYASPAFPPTAIIFHLERHVLLLHGGPNDT